MKKRSNKSVERRLKELEDFHYRVKLGRKWFLCAMYTLGGAIATLSYFLSSLNYWHLLNSK